MDQCQVCSGGVDEVTHTCKVAPYAGKTMRGSVCRSCGLVRHPENAASYLVDDDRHRGVRNATNDRPGREYFMAEMGLKVLGKTNAQVSFFGSGLNTDHQWLKRAYPDVTTKLVDLENMQQADNFESIQDATPSDVVIASEVIEHFSEPAVHFKSLLRLVETSGILICSSNIYDGSNIEKHQYPFVPGHVTYWTPLSLIKMAVDLGFFVDFRTPEIGLKRAGPRKKYIIFYRSTDTLFRLSNYFGTHQHAPSEKH